MFGDDSLKTFFRALTALARVSIMVKPREQAAKLAKTAADCHGGRFLSASDQQIIISQEPQHQLARLRMFTAMQYLLGARTVKGHLLKFSILAVKRPARPSQTHRTYIHCLVH